MPSLEASALLDTRQHIPVASFQLKLADLQVEGTILVCIYNPVWHLKVIPSVHMIFKVKYCRTKSCPEAWSDRFL